MKYDIKTLTTTLEGQTFDRKSARIDPKGLAVVLVAMANADGGSVAIGIEDNGIITGIDRYIENVNDLLRVPMDYCVPAISAHPEYTDCTNNDGNADHILILHVEQSNRLHATTADDAYLRVGDKSHKLGFEERMQLMFAKGVCYFEDEPVARAGVEDLDLKYVEEYCAKIGYGRDALTYLRSNKSFILEKEGKEQVSGAAILLFGIAPQRWFPRARVRVICYDGNQELTGAQMNVVKDEMFEGRIIDMTRASLAFVKTQIREHTFLGEGAIFRTVPDYPEFCWTELIVNAIAHRDYSIFGTDIQVKIFSDHLTVESPGILPGMVILGNLRTTHFSRNPKIAQMLHEYEYVREFGEGIDRVFREMAEVGQPAPEFKQNDFMLRATIRKVVPQDVPQDVPQGGTQNDTQGDTQGGINKSNYTASQINKYDTQGGTQDDTQGGTQELLDKIFDIIKDNPKITMEELATTLHVGRATIARHLKKMSDRVRYIGSGYSGHWEIITPKE